MKIILASASPRRKELLAQIGWQYEVCVSRVEEKITRTLPAEVVEELSRQKADEVFGRICRERDAVREDPDDLLVIGADTVVACDDKILGKPGTKEKAEQMLRLLQGRTHHVFTGVTMILKEKDQTVQRHTFHEETLVTFYPMTEEEILFYANTGEPADKAGAYGIQGLGARYVKEIRGDYGNVVGLPVGRLYQELRLMQKKRHTQKKAVIFDLDGTLSDSIASIKYCADRAVAPFGYGPFDVEQYYYFVGDGAANLIRRCLIAGGDTGLLHFEEAYALYRKLFQDDCMYQVKPYEGIPQLLKDLKERGLKIAVLSNKPHAETIRVIETLFGKDCFDVIQGQEPDIAIKPSPEGGFRILEKLRIRPEEALYLGDTATDMKTGKALGAFTVGALWGFRDREELESGHADAVIDRPGELMGYC